MVTTSKPYATTAPKVTGTATHGYTLTTTNGIWNGTPVVSFSKREWLRCNSTGGSCVVIAGAHGSTYKLGSGDVTHRIRSRITETNGVGSTAVASAPTAVVIWLTGDAQRASAPRSSP